MEFNIGTPFFILYLSHFTGNLKLVSYPINHYINCDKFYTKHKHYFATVTTVSEPTRFFEAVTNPKWYEAMKLEIDVFENNGKWEVTQLSPEKRALNSKWVYHIKYKADGTIE